ncbi:MFS general substrate transporter [Vararia minispora EC-137]|uniref:MFS general substrate transporter n=1 Tax=Vararia minispora EC-137 TaxID=1314806 RepID=A0ACB8QJ34_9AGAM|nr:MFS general substrate transporter [Vararia minispora EC-137]
MASLLKVASTTTKTSLDSSCEPEGHKQEPGTSWIAKEEQALPRNNLPVVLFGLLLCSFLAALDQTIVATSLPRIVADLGGGSDSGWVGSAYLLASAAPSPIYGKLYDITGGKLMLYVVLFTFVIGSALCGAARSMTWLIIARAVQGVGGGGILQLVSIVFADIICLKDRGKYGGAWGAMWGIASIIGPILGGVLSDRASWRWCFWINLPTAGIAFVVLFFSLHVSPRRGMNFRQHLAEFDFAGLILLVGGVVCLCLGLNRGEKDWSSPWTITLLTAGGVLLIAALINEAFTRKSAIIPSRLFKTRTTGILLITSTIYIMTFFSAAYYLPLYFQILGLSATEAGVRLLPLFLGASVVTAVCGLLITSLGSTRPIIWAGFVLLTLGYALIAQLSADSPPAMQVLCLLACALGVGALFQAPLIAVQAAMPARDVPAVTAACGLLHMLGGAGGIALGHAVCAGALRRKLGAGAGAAQLALSVGALHDVQDPVARTAIVNALAASIAAIWVVNAVLAGVATVMVLFIKNYTLERVTVQGNAKLSDQEVSAGSVESGMEVEEARTPADALRVVGDGQSESKHEESQ